MNFNFLFLVKINEFHSLLDLFDNYIKFGNTIEINIVLKRLRHLIRDKKYKDAEQVYYYFKFCLDMSKLLLN